MREKHMAFMSSLFHSSSSLISISNKLDYNG